MYGGVTDAERLVTGRTLTDNCANQPVDVVVMNALYSPRGRAWRVFAD
jgi:hypothetical protein